MKLILYVIFYNVPNRSLYTLRSQQISFPVKCLLCLSIRSSAVQTDYVPSCATVILQIHNFANVVAFRLPAPFAALQTSPFIFSAIDGRCADEDRRPIRKKRLYAAAYPL